MFEMRILKERFRRIEVTDNGPGKLLFVIMVSTAFLISGMLEVIQETSQELSHSVPKNNNSNADQGRRYCDPPNMTTVYLDFSEEVSDEYATSHNQEMIIENSISKTDIKKYKNGFFFGWAFTLSFLPACFFTSKYGANNVFSFSFLFMFINAFLYSFRQSVKIVLDIHMAVFSGFLFLSFYQMVYNFAPSCRNSMISIVSVKFVGLALGELLILLGREKLNYACNTLAVVIFIWFCIWWKIQFTSPRNEVFCKYQKRNSIWKTPWKDVLKSRPVWMTMAVIFGASCGASCILKGMRLYLEYIYFLEVRKIYYAVSSLLHFGFAISCGFFVDYLIKARIVSVTSSRRMIVYLSHFIPSGLLFVIGFVGCGLTTPIVLYCLSIMMTGANYTGAFSSPLDLAPKYSGPIMALCFFFGTLGNVLMDHLILYILTNQVFVSWRFIFSLNSLILLLTAIFFMLRGSGSVQQWNDPDNPPKERINKRVQQGKVAPAAPVPKPRTKSIYMVEKKILKVLHVQEPDKFTRVRAYSTSLPNERSNANPPNIYRPSNKKRASIS